MKGSKVLLKTGLDHYLAKGADWYHYATVQALLLIHCYKLYTSLEGSLVTPLEGLFQLHPIKADYSHKTYKFIKRGMEETM